MSLHGQARTVLGLAAACSLFGLAGCYSTEVPFHPAIGDPAQVGPNRNGYGQVTVPKDGLIVVEGDDMAYGSQLHGRGKPINGAAMSRSLTPFPETLGRLLGVRVENRGYPQDTLAEGEKRWAGRTPGNLLILAYGYGDAKNKTSGAACSESLVRMIRDAESHGAAVILLVAPGYKDKKLSVAGDCVRGAVQRAQADYGTGSFAVQTMLADKDAVPVNPLTLSDRDYSAVAYSLAPYILVAPPGAGEKQ